MLFFDPPADLVPWVRLFSAYAAVAVVLVLLVLYSKRDDD